MAVDTGFIVGILGNVISILVFTSPIRGTFRRVVRNKSTENFKGLPYVTTLLSTSLWSYYGLLKTNGLLIVTVNGAGSLLQAIYVVLFLVYAPHNTREHMMKLVGLLNVGFSGAVILVTFFAFHGSVRLLVIGFLCAGLTVGMYAAPLASMRLVVKTRSVEYMPFSLSFFLFLNGGVWSVYSLLVKDYFIGVPNAIGFVLGSGQLAIYIIYRRRTPSLEKDEDEGSAHLVSQLEMGEGKAPQEHLYRGSSLPKPSVTRQHSLAKIVKSLSLTPYELHAVWRQEDQVGPEP